MDIALKTLGTKDQQIYLNARSTSQGTQQMYNVTIDSDSDNVTTNNVTSNNININNVYATPKAIQLMSGFTSPH